MRSSLRIPLAIFASLLFGFVLCTALFGLHPSLSELTFETVLVPSACLLASVGLMASCFSRHKRNLGMFSDSLDITWWKLPLAAATGSLLGCALAVGLQFWFFSRPLP
jgi:hypothetical protein